MRNPAPYFDESGNNYQTLSSAKRGAQRIANRSGAQVDVFSQTVERWTDANGKKREDIQTAFAVRVQPKRQNPAKIRGWVKARAVKIVRNKRGQAVALRIKT